jgi:sugar phosphate isomerase/epimerase
MVHALIQPTIETYSEYLRFANLHDMGFEIIDFALPNVLNSDYEHIIKEYESKPDGEKPLFISQHGAALDLYINSRDKLIREVAEKRFKDNLVIADRLGVYFTVFHSGIIPLIGQKSYYENWVKSHVEFWDEAVKNHKTSILLENLWDLSPHQLLEVIGKVNSPKLNVCFDTGHCNAFSESPMKEWFRVLGKKIPYIHLNDNLGDFDSELPAGRGNINWLEFNDAVNEYCDKPLVVIEVSSLKDIAESIHYLEKNRIYPFN